MKRSENLSEQCPTNDFTLGEPKGKCWGDGHYLCKSCENFRADFKTNGQNYIDSVHNLQDELQIING